MAKGDVGDKPNTLERMTDGPERMVVITVGFCIYPTESGVVGDSCDGVIFPKADLFPHRPVLTFPKSCVKRVDGVPVMSEDANIMRFDLTGYSACFNGQSGKSHIIQRHETAGGHFPDPIPVADLDFNLVPDAHTFFRGLRLSKDWRRSDALQASFSFLPGRIGGWADDGTMAFESKWGFTKKEMAKKRRKTNITVHASDGLPTRIIEMHEAGTGRRVGEIEVQPSPEWVVAVLTNEWRGADNDRMLINLSHVGAMLSLCEHEDVTPKADFGHKTALANPTSTRQIRREVLAPVGALGVVDAMLKVVNDVAARYNSDISCSGRQMRMS